MNEQCPLTLRIGGMHCDACVRRLSGSLQKLPGVTVENVQVGEARLAYDPAQVGPPAIAAAIRNAGFETEAGQNLE